MLKILKYIRTINDHKATSPVDALLHRLLSFCIRLSMFLAKTATLYNENNHDHPVASLMCIRATSPAAS